MYGCSGALLMSWRTLSHDPHYHHLDLVVQPQQPPPHLAIVKPSDVGRSVVETDVRRRAIIALHLTSSTTSPMYGTRNSAFVTDARALLLSRSRLLSHLTLILFANTCTGELTFVSVFNYNGLTCTPNAGDVNNGHTFNTSVLLCKKRT